MKNRICLTLIVCLQLSIAFSQASKIQVSVNSAFNKTIGNANNWYNTKYKVGYGINATYEAITRKNVTLQIGLNYTHLPVNFSWGFVDDFDIETAVEESNINRLTIPLNMKYKLFAKGNFYLNVGLQKVIAQNIDRKIFKQSLFGSDKTKMNATPQSLYNTNGNKNFMQLTYGIQKDICIGNKKFTIALTQINELQKSRLTQTFIAEQRNYDFKNQTTCLSIATSLATFLKQ